MTSEILAQADQAFAAGRFEQSAGLCRSVLQTEPGNFPAQLLLGVVYVKQGLFQEAVPVLLRARQADPGSGKASLWLSRALRNLGKLDEALPYALSAVESNLGDPGARYQLGICYLECRQFEEALSCFQQVIEVDPRAATVHHGLGLALRSLGRNSAALDSFQRAAALAPGSLQILTSLYEALIDESDSAGAVECARKLLSIQPNAESHLRLARALAMNSDIAGAEASLREGERLGLRDGFSVFAAGSILQSLGRIAEAESQFRRTVDLLPTFGPGYSALAYVRKVGEEDLRLVAKMEAISEDGHLSLSDASHVHYALGKSREDLGEYELSMTNYDKANELALQALGGRSFDKALYASRVDDAIARFGSGRSDAGRTSGSLSDVPIFVIGMLRSGTTLVEQILSSHLEVGSAGEQGFWMHNRDASLEGLPVLAERYISILSAMCPDKRHVVDKMPDNYLVAPLLYAAFPRAKIIHVNRDPADTCFSIYTTINRLRIEWAHDKENIAFVYRQYLRMMAAWREILPPRTMLEVRYEDLVLDRDRVTREMVDFCGLGWDEAVLNPEQNPRAVSTPSAWQVRQPVYTSSVGRSKKFSPWLGPFAEIKPMATASKAP